MLGIVIISGLTILKEHSCLLLLSGVLYETSEDEVVYMAYAFVILYTKVFESYD
jgi:hypothetical protein